DIFKKSIILMSEEKQENGDDQLNERANSSSRSTLQKSKKKTSSTRGSATKASKGKEKTESKMAQYLKWQKQFCVNTKPTKEYKLATDKAEEYLSYLKWQNCVPYMYDQLVMYPLPYPSQSVQWAPAISEQLDHPCYHSLILTSKTHVAKEETTTTRKSRSHSNSSDNNLYDSKSVSPVNTSKTIMEERFYLQNVHFHLHSRHCNYTYTHAHTHTQNEKALLNVIVVMFVQQKKSKR
ncbi:hypothetical protein RFI_11740, partial [Reticulomyxa filosa]